MVGEQERRVLISALLAQRQFGSASPELAVRRSGLSRTAGYAALAALERRGLVERNGAGLIVSRSARRLAGL